MHLARRHRSHSDRAHDLHSGLGFIGGNHFGAFGCLDRFFGDIGAYRDVFGRHILEDLFCRGVCLLSTESSKSAKKTDNEKIVDS